MVTQRVVDAREDAPHSEASFDRIMEVVAVLEAIIESARTSKVVEVSDFRE